MMRQFIKYTVEKKQQLMGRCLQWDFFPKAFFWQCVSKLNICVLQQQETVCEGLIRYRYEYCSHDPVCILLICYMPNWYITWKN